MTETILNPTSNAKPAVFEPAVRRIPADLETPDTPQESTIPRWTALPTAPEAAEAEACESCHRRALCRWAQEELRAGQALEQKAWTVLSLCGAVTILYAAYCFFFRH